MATPFLRTEIPFDTARLKSLIKVFATFGGYVPDPNDPNIINLSNLELVGAVNTVTLNETRAAAERRELNYDTHGEIIEMIAGLGSFEISFTSIVLYKQTFMEACGFAGHELRFQTRPIAFFLELPSPDPAVISPKTLLLRGCKLLANPLSFDIEAKDDLRIVQEVPVACAGIIEDTIAA